MDYLATAAAAVVAAKEKDNESDNDNPGAVVIEKVAKAVVIHKVSPFGEAFFAPSIVEYDSGK